MKSERDPLLRKVREAIGSDRLLRERDSVLVAVSGGPDSVALLAALHALAAGRWRIAVAHVNHGLRGRESDADQRFVERLAKTFDLEIHVAHAAIEPGANLEERAREQRYDRLREIAAGHRLRRIATGHTLDDQAETVLMRLLRGAGAAGLGGILAVREDGVVRPLLGCSRTEVLSFLARRKLGHRKDSSNRDDRFTRNRVRRKLIPLLEREFNPAVKDALVRTAALLRDDDAVLSRRASVAWRRTRGPGGLDRQRLLALPAALRRRVVRLWLASERGNLRRIDAGHLERIGHRLDLGRGRVSIPGGVVSVSRNLLQWGELSAPPDPLDKKVVTGRWMRFGAWQVRLRSESKPPRLRPGRWRALFDRLALPGGSLRLRSVLPGDRIRPLGLNGSRKLQDVFVDAKIPRDQRGGWPILVADRTVLWVPGLVRADAAPLSEDTDDVLVVEARRR